MVGFNLYQIDRWGRKGHFKTMAAGKQPLNSPRGKFQKQIPECKAQKQALKEKSKGEFVLSRKDYNKYSETMKKSLQFWAIRVTLILTMESKMNSLDQRRVEESLSEVFREPKQGLSRDSIILKRDFRKIMAEYRCDCPDMQEEMCTRYKLSSSGNGDCAFTKMDGDRKLCIHLGAG
jgi:hypothetical protein